MLSRHQQCPRCHGLIPTDDFAREPIAHLGKEITLLYCDFCQLGIETLWTVTQREHLEEFSLEYDAREPENLGAFKQRLRDRRVA